MKSKLMIVLALVLVLNMAMIPFAEAVTLKGTGVLVAKGDGMAKFHGRGLIKIRGNGVLWVKDVGGDALIVVRGYGKKIVLPDGTIRYSGFHGRAKIRGSNIKVKICGMRIQLFAKGTGVAILRGRGVYRVDGKVGRWTPRGVVIRLADGCKSN